MDRTIRRGFPEISAAAKPKATADLSSLRSQDDSAADDRAEAEGFDGQTADFARFAGGVTMVISCCRS